MRRLGGSSVAPVGQVLILAVAAQNGGTAALEIMAHGMKQLSILLGTTPVPDSHVVSRTSG
jgi:hypothetical protein